MSQDSRDRTLAARVRGVRALAGALSDLRSLDVVRSPDVAGDVAVWMVVEAYRGVRALPKSRKGWDVQVPSTGEQFRVLALRHDPASPRAVLEGRTEGFTHLVVAILNDDFRLRTLYKVPRPHLPLKEGAGGVPTLLLTLLDPWIVNPRSLPGAKAIAPLLAG